MGDDVARLHHLRQELLRQAIGVRLLLARVSDVDHQPCAGLARGTFGKLSRLDAKNVEDGAGHTQFDPQHRGLILLHALDRPFQVDILALGDLWHAEQPIAGDVDQGEYPRACGGHQEACEPGEVITTTAPRIEQCGHAGLHPGQIWHEAVFVHTDRAHTGVYVGVQVDEAWSHYLAADIHHPIGLPGVDVRRNLADPPLRHRDVKPSFQALPWVQHLSTLYQ